MITTDKKSLKQSGRYVNTEHVDTILRTYKKERWVHNSERIGKPDSLSTWYTIDELEEYIETIKNHGADGIKIYFAAYPSDFSEKPEYADRQTVVMVATKQIHNGENVINKDIYVTTENGPEILAYNMVNMCPPFCNGFGTDDGLGIAVVDTKQGIEVV